MIKNKQSKKHNHKAKKKKAIINEQKNVTMFEQIK